MIQTHVLPNVYVRNKHTNAERAVDGFLCVSFSAYRDSMSHAFVALAYSLIYYVRLCPLLLKRKREERNEYELQYVFSIMRVYLPRVSDDNC